MKVLAFHWKSSSIEGGSSSINCCLLSKIIFHWRSSFPNSCRQLIVVFNERSPSIKAHLLLEPMPKKCKFIVGSWSRSKVNSWFQSLTIIWVCNMTSLSFSTIRVCHVTSLSSSIVKCVSIKTQQSLSAPLHYNTPPPFHYRQTQLHS